MKRTLALLCLLYCTSVLAAVAAKAEPESVLAGVPALAKGVTLSETKIPLGELLQRVADETGVPLRAVREVSGEPVAIVVKDVPAAELLTQLADLLDFQWSRRGAAGAWRYEIRQTTASKQREKALRDAVYRDALKRLRRELALYQEVAPLSPEQLRELLAAGERRQNEASPAEAAGDPSRRAAEEREQKRRYQAALALRAPVDRLVTRIIGKLTGAQWESLLRDGELVLATEGRYGGQRLLPAFDEQLRATPPLYMRPGDVTTVVEDGVVIPPNDPRWAESLRQEEEKLHRQWGGATGFRIRLQLDSDELATEGVLSLDARVYPIPPGEGRQVPVTGGVVHVAAGPDEALLAGETNEPDAASGEQDPVFGVKRRFRPEAMPRPAFGNGPNWTPRELLPDLARTYGVSFLANAYWQSPSIRAAQLAGAEPATLAARLDRLAGPTHRWDRHGSLVRLRSRRWFFERPREVPLPLVRRWAAGYERNGALPFGEYVEGMGSLTDAQTEGLAFAAEDARLEPLLTVAYPARHALRLVASLAVGQRAALQRGESLPVSEMNRRQRALFLTALRHRGRYNPMPRDLTAWEAGNLTLGAGAAISAATNQTPRVTIRLRYGPEAWDDFRVTVAAAP